MIETIKTVLENTQNRTPMVHSITNNVTINDCANIILAAGGTAIMAQDEREVEEITSHAQALVINMGAVRAQEAMLRAAKIAKRNGRPVVLDPVAAGASTLRREMCSFAAMHPRCGRSPPAPSRRPAWKPVRSTA